MSQTILDKLALKNEKNILIQGLPSSIEKQFAKLSFAKNLTPLLKSRKLDFALIFAVSESQLNNILADIVPALKEETRLWVAHPKTTSKISTDLNRDSSWSRLYGMGYETLETVSLDHVWQAISFNKCEVVIEETVEEVKVPRKTKKAVAA
ncbi:hypothetical protein [Flavisolibacter nicotianae]|uniref:hypothetical protein n=1 Tax=Flavisolibacter nicotianae TaxID=2364882 RepID=UPI001968C84E|nr:hypothetical protein [Flavisolibacter nicotianae]